MSVIAAYALLLRRRKKAALRFASLSLMKDAIGPGQRFRRHVPPLLFLLAVIAAIVAIARPTAVITLPSQVQTIVLASSSGTVRLSLNDAGRTQARGDFRRRHECRLHRTVVLVKRRRRA